MTEQKAKQWFDAERKLLDGVLNQLIPASSDGKIPSAAMLGVSDFLAKRVSTDKVLGALFQQGLTRLLQLTSVSEFNTMSMDKQRAIVQQLEQQEPEFFAALLRQTYMGYYSDSRVRPLFGLSAKPTQPDGYDVAPDNPKELATLVAPVIRRGNCFREC